MVRAESLPLPPLLQGTKEIDLAQREQVELDHLAAAKAYLGGAMSDAVEAEKDSSLDHISHLLGCRYCDLFREQIYEELWDALMAKKKWKKRAKKAEKHWTERPSLNTYGYAAPCIIGGMDQVEQRARDAGREFPDRFWLIDDKEKERVEAFLK